MECVIKNRTFIYNDKSFVIEDFFTDDFLEYSNQIAPRYDNDSVAVNELFYYYTQRYLALVKWIEDNCITDFVFENPQEELYCYIKDYQWRISGKSRKKTKWFFNCFSPRVILFLSSFYLFYKLVVRIPYSDKILRKGPFVLIRSKAVASKFRNFDFEKYFETPFDNKAVYSYFSRYERIRWLLSSSVKASSEFKKIVSLVLSYIGPNALRVCLPFYSKRLVHTFIFERLLEGLLRRTGAKEYYTGNNIDRYSVIEDRVCSKYSVKSICYPHGLEWGFRFPRGFAGTVFFANSPAAADYLNALYETDKFVHDPGITSTMFRVDGLEKAKPKLVFFTEPSEQNVNFSILDSLLPKLENEGIRLYLKLHPREKEEDYIRLYGSRISFIPELNKALFYNICFSRKSTTLLESVYNGSVAAAIILNSKDNLVYNTYPSLHDSRISVFYSINDLYEWILKSMSN